MFNFFTFATSKILGLAPFTVDIGEMTELELCIFFLD